MAPPSSKSSLVFLNSGSTENSRSNFLILRVSNDLASVASERWVYLVSFVHPTQSGTDFTRRPSLSSLFLLTFDIIPSVFGICHQHSPYIKDVPPPDRPLSNFPVSVATLSTLDVQILTHPSKVHDAFWKLIPDDQLMSIAREMKLTLIIVVPQQSQIRKVIN
jgi:hypothetical protein